MRHRHLAACAIFFLTFTAFLPALRNGFARFDDLGYLEKNRHIQHGFTRADIHWAFTTNYAGNWHPLTWLSHTLDWQLFGIHPLCVESVAWAAERKDVLSVMLGLLALWFYSGYARQPRW